MGFQDPNELLLDVPLETNITNISSVEASPLQVYNKFEKPQNVVLDNQAQKQTDSY